MQRGTIAPANGGDTAEQNESMSRVRVRWQACVPASKQNHQGRVTGRRSESSLPAPAALEEKLPGTTVILVAVPAASALISSFATAGDTCKRALYLRDKLLGQPSRLLFRRCRVLFAFREHPPAKWTLSFSFGLARRRKLVVRFSKELSTNFAFVFHYFVLFIYYFFLILFLCILYFLI